MDTDSTAKREAGRRRRFSQEFKRQLLEETLAGGGGVAGIALRQHLSANLVFTWRRQYLRALASIHAKPVSFRVYVRPFGSWQPRPFSRLGQMILEGAGLSTAAPAALLSTGGRRGG